MLIAHTSMDQDSINALRENLVDMLKYALLLSSFLELKEIHRIMRRSPTAY